MDASQPEPPQPALLFALRLSPAAARGVLRGEVEHVLSGEVRPFDGAAELLAWLQGHAGGAAAQAPAGPVDDVAPREATR